MDSNSYLAISIVLTVLSGLWLLDAHHTFIDSNRKYSKKNPKVDEGLFRGNEWPVSSPRETEIVFKAVFTKKQKNKDLMFAIQTVRIRFLLFIFLIAVAAILFFTMN